MYDTIFYALIGGFTIAKLSSLMTIIYELIHNSDKKTRQVLEQMIEENKKTLKLTIEAMHNESEDQQERFRCIETKLDNKLSLVLSKLVGTVSTDKGNYKTTACMVLTM